MALRLTSSPAGQTSAPAAPPAESLATRAAALITAKDLSGYLALFDEAARIEDVHRRYQARKRLIESGLGARGSSLATAGPVFLAVARAALDVLEEEPREPVLLTYAGVALYELGDLPAAEALFKAADRLDAELPHVRRNLAEIARRRREGITSLGLPGPLAVALKELTPRAKRLAQAARPAEGKRISLCMIVKDEEAMLGRTLAAVAAHVDEIVVVDTGSTDRTVAIAEEFGARVLHHEWTGDFAGARNVSLEAATGDWILYLDADEVLVEDDGPRLRALAGRTWREAFYLVFTNHTGDIEDGTAVQFNALRLFRNRPEYRFEGRLHEQYAHRLPGFLKERLEATTVRIDHFGYLGVVRDGKEKSRRNIELLTRQIAEGADGPFVHFNLGSELAAAGEAAPAAEEFRTAWRLLEADGGFDRRGYAPSLGSRLVATLRVVGRHDEALERAAAVLEQFPGFTDIVLQKALIAIDRGEHAEGEALLGECLELGDAPSKYSPTVGSGTYLALLALADLAKRQDRLSDAEALVERCLAEHPKYLGVVEPYASTRLAAGADADAVVGELTDALGELSPGARFMLAVALSEAGASTHAEDQLQHVVDARPGSAPARLALAETLLAQGRFADAAAAVEPVEADSPWASRALSTRLFAALTGGDHAAAGALLETAGILPTGERVLFEAWRAAAAGEPASAPLPPSSADPALVMLNALARVEAFEAFEALVGCLALVDVPARERRERLAQLYMRRGFLESAADEWIAACEEDGPDARAMLGLAQIAWARGLDEDAAAFAEEARALDPGNAGAGALLAHLATAA
jgi:tetratricopeptide (TPR) repeat protein